MEERILSDGRADIESNICGGYLEKGNKESIFTEIYFFVKKISKVFTLAGCRL
jgi:hypothetical protein